MEHYQQEDGQIFFSDEDEEKDLDSSSDCQRDFTNFSSLSFDDVNPTREEMINDNRVNDKIDEGVNYMMEEEILDSELKMIREKREEEIKW